MSKTIDICFFCPNDVNKYSYDDNDIVELKCINCGTYRMSNELYEDIKDLDIYRKNKSNLSLVSGYIREMNEKNFNIGILTSVNIEDFLHISLSSKSLSDKINLALLDIYKKTVYYSQDIKIDLSQFAVCYAKNTDEYHEILRVLCEMGSLKRGNDISYLSYSLTVKGFSKAESLMNSNINSNQCFVAMWYSDEIINVYSEVCPLIKEKTGYDPLIIKYKEHNNNICDEIIAEIRRSKFLIADFTGRRGGVYFEAGFAYGLGIPVIWTCKRKEIKKVHFDVNHYNFILWDTADELAEGICNRILATLQ